MALFLVAFIHEEVYNNGLKEQKLDNIESIRSLVLGNFLRNNSIAIQICHIKTRIGVFSKNNFFKKTPENT